MISNMDQQTYDFRGLSKDIKPVSEYVGNGSTFIEMDTGKVFMYDAENKIWKEV